MLKHGIRFINGKDTGFAKILDQLKDNGVEYELVPLTDDEIRNIRLLSALS